MRFVLFESVLLVAGTLASAEEPTTLSNPPVVVPGAIAAREPVSASRPGHDEKQPDSTAAAIATGTIVGTTDGVAIAAT
jgi:hypothetical protein